MINNVRVIGLGKVGELVAPLLHDSGFSVTASTPGSATTCRSRRPPSTSATPAPCAPALAGADAVVCAMPFYLNLGVAEAAHAAGVHYFDLTEDVPTTNRVRELAEQAR